MQRIRVDNGPLHGYVVQDSSHIEFVGWVEGNGGMVVQYAHERPYIYPTVSRQQAVAVALAPSVGTAMNTRIKPKRKRIPYAALRIPVTI